jgi:hypothetical protein
LNGTAKILANLSDSTCDLLYLRPLQEFSTSTFGLCDMAFQVLALLFINMVCLDFITSIPVLYVVGVRLEHLGIEKKIRDATEKTVNDIAETSK